MLKTREIYLTILPVIAAMALVPMTVYGEEAAELSEFKQAIRAKYDLMEEAWATDNPALIYDQFYSSDARGLAADEPRSYKGRAQMKEMWDDVALRGEVRIESVESYVNGDAGWDWANMYADYHDENVEPFSVMYLFLWSKENGEWKCKGDMYVVGEFDPANTEGQLYEP